MAFALLATGAARADGAATKVVCYDDFFVPFFMQKDEHIEGISADTVIEAGKRAGIQVELRQMPWRRLETELARGPASKVQCAFALSRTPVREQHVEFGKVPLNPTDYVVFVRDGSGIENLDDLNGKTIGVRAGVRIAEAIAAGNKQGRWNLAEVGTDAANFQKLVLGRVDAVVTDQTGGLYTLRQMKLGGVHHLQPAIMHYDTFMVFVKSAEGAALAAAFDRALDKMRQDGTTERIMERYVGQAAPTK
ncbi:MAG: substrate-binding periplasmic protein [Telluria sp.]